jgi:hypothetical protein
MRAEMRPELERDRGTGQWADGPITAIINTVGDDALVLMTATCARAANWLKSSINTQGAPGKRRQK